MGEAEISLSELADQFDAIEAAFDAAIEGGGQSSPSFCWEAGAEAVRLRRLREKLDRAVARRATVFKTGEGYVADGYASISTWMADRAHVTPAEASRSARLGEFVARHPRLDHHWREGDLSERHVAAIMGLARRFPRFFEVCFDSILLAMMSVRVDQIPPTVRRLEELAVADGGEEDDARKFEQRNAFASSSINGSVLGKFTLYGDQAAKVKAAFDAGIQIARDQDAALGDPHRRSDSQRAADTLVDMAELLLADAAAAGHTGARTRPQITAVVDYDLLAGDPDAPGDNRHIDRVGMVGREMLRRMACDSVIHPMLTFDGSVPLDHGRSVRTATAAQRRALELRDGHCQGPGCDRPAWWSDAHHIVHWADGGSTDLDNLVLLCSFHHHLVHEGGWTIERGSDGEIVWTEPSCNSRAGRRIARKDLRRRRRAHRQRIEEWREQHRHSERHSAQQRPDRAPPG